MTNGLNINISEEQFKQKPPAEQNWIIFKAVERVDLSGCSFGRKFHKKDNTNKIIVFAGTFGGAIGTAIGLWAFLLR